MRPAAGAAVNGVPLDAQRVGDRRDVVGGVRDRPAGRGIRASVAGPVVGQEANPSLLGVLHDLVPEEPRAGSPVQGEDRAAFGISRLGDAERPPADVDSVLSQASYVVSRASRHVGFAMRPAHASAVFDRVEFIPLNAARVLVVIVAGHRVSWRSPNDTTRGADTL